MVEFSQHAFGHCGLLHNELSCVLCLWDSCHAVKCENVLSFIKEHFMTESSFLCLFLFFATHKLLGLPHNDIFL